MLLSNKKEVMNQKTLCSLKEAKHRKTTNYVIPFIGNAQKGQIIKTEISGCLGLGWGWGRVGTNCKRARESLLRG